MTPEEWRQGMENEAESVQDREWARDTRRMVRTTHPGEQAAMWGMRLVAFWVLTQPVFLKELEGRATGVQFSGSFDTLTSPLLLPLLTGALAWATSLWLARQGRPYWPVALLAAVPVLAAALVHQRVEALLVQITALTLRLGPSPLTFALDLPGLAAFAYAVLPGMVLLAAFAGGRLGRRGLAGRGLAGRGLAGRG